MVQIDLASYLLRLQFIMLRLSTLLRGLVQTRAETLTRTFKLCDHLRHRLGPRRCRLL